MVVRKQYGKTTPKCLFCGKDATCYNKDRVPTCRICKDKEFEPKCPVCGEEMETLKGKYGTFFRCELCHRNWGHKAVRGF